MKLKKAFCDFMKDEAGQSMVEYILLGALICVVCLGSLKLFQPALEKAFDNCANCTGIGGIGVPSM